MDVTHRASTSSPIPRGRKYGSRPGVSADWDRVFTAAQRANVAIRNRRDPSRQDIELRAGRGAVAGRCLFALDSDATLHRRAALRGNGYRARPLAGSRSNGSSNCWGRSACWKWTRSDEIAKDGLKAVPYVPRYSDRT